MSATVSVSSIATVDQVLARAGYVRGVPPWVQAGNAAIDREVCEGSTCQHCGHCGLTYVPFYRPEPRSYRALGSCPSCGETFEF